MNVHDPIVIICSSCLLFYFLLCVFAFIKIKRGDRKRAAFAARLKKTPGNLAELDFRENSKKELLQLFGSKKGDSHGSGSNVHSKQ